MADRPENRNPRVAAGNPDGFPDVYIAMGQTAENVARREDISREDQDKFALRIPAARRRRPGQRLLRPRDHSVPLPDGAGEMTTDDGPRRETSSRTRLPGPRLP